MSRLDLNSLHDFKNMPAFLQPFQKVNTDDFCLRKIMAAIFHKARKARLMTVDGKGKVFNSRGRRAGRVRGRGGGV